MLIPVKIEPIRIKITAKMAIRLQFSQYFREGGQVLLPLSINLTIFYNFSS
jgi:hypothetical protein